MLNKKEKALMSEIYKEASKKNGNCMIRAVDLLSRIPYSIELKKDELDSTIQVLVLDDYIDVVESDKKGEPYYVITLQKKGKAFKREMVNQKRNIYFNLFFKIGLSVIVGIIGLLFFLLKK